MNDYLGGDKMRMDGLFSLMYILLVLLALALPTVLADGDDDNLTTSVSVGNASPTVGTITCAASPLTLTAETTTLLNCTATVSDNNGYQDLNSIRGEFYNDSVGAAGNYTKHYNNASCIFTTTGSDTDRDVECTFNVYFHANPANWTIYLNVTDDSGLTGNNTDHVVVNSLIALNVTQTEIAFGEVSLGAESNQQTTAIKNTGNVELDLEINESANGGYMPCTTGSIQTDAETTGVRYNTTTDFVFDDTLWKLTSGNNNRDVNWAKSNSYNTGTPPEYNLYWKIKLPSSGISGSCSTTTRISATTN